MNIWCGKCLPKKSTRIENVIQQLRLSWEYVFVCLFSFFFSFKFKAKLFPHFCVCSFSVDIEFFCIPQAHTHTHTSYIMYHPCSGYSFACMHACMHVCRLKLYYIHKLEWKHSIELMHSLHVNIIHTTIKEWMNCEWKRAANKKTTCLNNTWKSQHKNFSDTFHKMCAVYSVNAFGRLLWTSHSVKFLFLFFIFSCSFTSHTHIHTYTVSERKYFKRKVDRIS